ncbi:MAG TPA: HepT-like ribonuclease domain-containing protein, partial [Geminicoccaceae bacterium]|nr:HepT-like ribonuclease domain-containing protein [Geminicoccaceae bacterium]
RLPLAAGKSRAEFDTDEVLRLALTYLIQIVGEVASQVSQETKDAHPEIPRHSIVGVRHRLVHGYFAIDEDIVWKTLTTELEPLLRALERMPEARAGSA